MNPYSWLNIYFLLAAVLSAFTWTSLGWNIFSLGWLRRRGPERNGSASGTPPARGWFQALRQFAVDPCLHFHRRTNRLWSHGYIFYHIGLFTILAGYAVTILILAVKLLSGAALPNLTPAAGPQAALAPANILALTFGNAESAQRRFLFGSFAPLFLGVTWVGLSSALYGQVCQLGAQLLFGQGAMRRGPDPVSRDLRRDGRFSGQHLLVTSIVFSIVVTEILARLQIVSDIVYYHAALGLTLLILLPHTYLAHIFIAPLALVNGLRRRRFWTTA